MLCREVCVHVRARGLCGERRLELPGQTRGSERTFPSAAAAAGSRVGFVSVLSRFCLDVVSDLSRCCLGFISVLSRICLGFAVCIHSVFPQCVSTVRFHIVVPQCVFAVCSHSFHNAFPPCVSTVCIHSVFPHCVSTVCFHNVFKHRFESNKCTACCT